MSETTNTSAPDAARVSQIAQAIRGAVSAFIETNETKVSAHEASQKANANETNAREITMVTLADLSQIGQWTEPEIKLAAAKTVEMTSNLEAAKAIATYIGEAKKAMHPMVRSHVPAIVALRNECWGNETVMLVADKTSPASLRKAFVRQYHMLQRMMGEYIDGKPLHDETQVLAWAAANDPEIDPAKVAKVIEGMVKNLEGIFARFPDGALQAGIEALQGVTKANLAKHRSASASVIEGKPVHAHGPTLVPSPNKVAAIPKAPTVVSAVTETEVDEGAVDPYAILDGPEEIAA